MPALSEKTRAKLTSIAERIENNFWRPPSSDVTPQDCMDQLHLVICALVTDGQEEDKR